MIPLRSVAFAILLAAQTPAQAPVRYVVVDLGVLPGDTSSRPRGINANGDVVGTSSASLQHRAFVYRDATGLVAIANPPGRSRAFGMAINDLGQVALATSYGACSGIVGNPYLWTPGQGYVDLGSLGGVCDPQGLDNHGRVVGFAEPVACQPTPFAYTVANGIAAVAGVPAGIAAAINDSGTIAGHGAGGAFRFVPGSGVAWLSPPSGYPVARAQAIDGNGVVAGIATTNNGHVAHLFRDVPGVGPIDEGWVGKKTRVGGAAPNGRFVGTWDDDAGTQYGFVWDPQNGVQNLNGLLVDPTWHVREAFAVNDAGQIAAYGWRGTGSGRALRLDPVPAGAVAAVGTPCGVGGGVLTAAPPRLGTSVALVLSSTAPGSPALLVTALGGPLPTMIAGCVFEPDLTAPYATAFALTGLQGQAQWTLAVPPAPSFVGTRITAQSVVLRTALATGNGLLLTVGF